MGKSCFYKQPQGIEELTIERVQDDVEIETEGQTDAFAVSHSLTIFQFIVVYIYLRICGG